MLPVNLNNVTRSAVTTPINRTNIDTPETNNNELVEYSKRTTSKIWEKLSLNPENKLKKIRRIGIANIIAIKLVKIFQNF